MHEVVEDEKVLCVVLRLAEGGDLFEYIRAHGKLSREESWRIFSQVVEGISYAHSQGFIHRDIKPENIFLDNDGNVLIGDWGFGTRWFSGTPRSHFYGSPNYASPEILNGEYYIGPECDIFSLGAVLYACLTGNVPFGPNRHPNYKLRVDNGLWLPHPLLTPEESQLFNRMFDPEALRRITPFEIFHLCKQKQEREKEEEENREKEL